jgi:hypothetical protein
VATVDVNVALHGVPHIVEVKTVHYGVARYGGARPARNAAVELRAAQVPRERREQIARTDAEVFGTLPGQVGPLEARLNTFPPPGVVGVVAGAFGEWSRSLVDLLKTFAAMGAETWQGRLSAPTPLQSRSTLLWLMRAELGMCVVRGHAKLILARARAHHAQCGPAVGAGRGAPVFPRSPSATGPSGCAAPRFSDNAFYHRPDGLAGLGSGAAASRRWCRRPGGPRRRS